MLERELEQRLNMQNASLLDPSILDFFTIKSILEDIENLVEAKKRAVEKDFKEFEKKHKVRHQGEEWYLWQEARYVDEIFIVSELESNLLNGLAVTVNTIFERHVGFFVREISKTDPSIKFDEKHTYKMYEIEDLLEKTKHPNRKDFSKDLQSKLRIYTDIRNSIIHQEGTIKSKGTIKSFVTQNASLFKIKNKELWIISVNAKYIREVLKIHKYFFRLLFYTKSGDVIYY